MKRARPIAERRRRGRAPALAALAGLCAGLGAGPAPAQDAGDLGPGNDPISNRAATANGRLGLSTGADGLPTLRGGTTTLGTAAAAGTGARRGSVFDDATQGDAAQGDSTRGLGSGGVSSGGEGLSRLPRFRTGGAAVSSSARTAQAPPNPLRQRAAPPRRFGSATRTITQTRTQTTTTDLRLTPVIQTAVSGVPLPTTIPLLGLQNPAGLLLGTALRRPLVVDDAYAPLGIRLGTFTVLPAFTQSVGFDTNPDQVTARLAKPSLALRSEGEVAFRSDWSSSAFEGEMRGGYLAFPQDDASSRPNAAGATRLRIDANRDTRLDLETRFVVDTQRVGSPELSAAATGRPIYATYGVTAGVQESFNRLQLSLRGSVDRQVFEDGTLSDGTRLIQSDRDSNQYGVRLRAAYEITPSLAPFVETLVDTRVYDRAIDQFGLRRDSDGVAFSLGTTVALARSLTGEVSGGVQHRSYVDASLKPITAPILNAALIWSASPLTTVRLNQQVGIVETSVVGSSGVITEIATLEVQHDLLRNLSITLGGAYLSNDYQDVRIREHGFSATARLDYRLNRWLTLRGSYIYQNLASTAVGASFQSNTMLLGVRVSP